jgi:hypothetical protein
MRVKLLAGMLSGDADLMLRATQLLKAEFGPADLVSELWPFDHTDYYEAELGAGLLRRFVSFEQLIAADRLADIKRATNELEERLAEDVLPDRPGRVVNIDPGYIAPSKLVLATTKDHGHRIYLGRGVYAEVTLRYRDGAWEAWPWTYPDYASGLYFAFFEDVRTRLKQQLDSGV